MLPQINIVVTASTIEVDFVPALPTWHFKANNRCQFEFVILSIINGEHRYNPIDHTTAELVREDVTGVLRDWENAIVFSPINDK